MTESKKKQRQRERIAAAKKKQRVRMMMIGTITVVILAIAAFLLIYFNSDSGSEDNNAAKSSGTDTEKADFSYKDQPVLGDKTAPVKIVEFGDYKCPACRDFTENVFPKVKKELIDSGQAAFYFMNYPVIKGSQKAALAAEAIYHQDNDMYWKYHEAIYDNQGDETKNWATKKFILDLSKEHVPNVDIDQLKTDIEEQTYLDQIKNDTKEAINAGVEATPTIFVNGKKLDGVDFASIQKAVEKAKNDE